jgi:acyl carrier protein
MEEKNKIRAEIETVIKEVLNNTSNKVDLSDMTSDLKKLGFDELDYTEIIIECEEKYDIIINDLEFDQCKTINSMIDFVEKLIISR